MKRLAIFGVILSLIVPIFTRADKKVDKEYNELEILDRTLEDFQGEFLNSETIINGIILDKFIEEEEATRLAEEILSKLKIKGREVDPLVYTEKNKGDI